MEAFNKWEKMTYPEVLAANARAARAQAKISQKVLAERMRQLGFEWAHQTVGKIENCNRPLFAAEILGLAVALNTSISALMAAPEGDLLIKLTEDVQIGARSVRTLAYGHAERPVTWHEGEWTGVFVAGTPFLAEGAGRSLT